MRRIRFIKNLGYHEGQGTGPHYEQGKTYPFDGVVAEGYAQAYIDRGYAVEADAEAEQPKRAAEPLKPRFDMKGPAKETTDQQGLLGKAPAEVQK